MKKNDDTLRIVVGGTAYGEWLEADFDSDIFMAADAWSLTGATPTENVLTAFREGAKCDIYLGSDRQLSGVIDDVALSGDRGTSRIRLSGRDKGAYLVDSEADAFKAKNLTLKSLAEKMLHPSFGIKRVIDSNEENRKLVLGKKDKKGVRSKSAGLFAPKPRVSLKIDPGQTIASIIDQHTRRLGLTWWMTANGDLIIGKPNYDQEVAYYFRSELATSRKSIGNNIDSWSIKRSLGGRYSELQVNGAGIPGKPPVGAVGAAGAAAALDVWDVSKRAPKFKAIVHDPDLQSRGIYRRTVLRDCDVLNKEEALHRAQMEMGQHRLDGLTINVTVSGFRDRETERIYSIDTLASVKIPEAGIDGVYYVTQRRFRENRQKQTTELTLKEKGIWLA